MSLCRLTDLGVWVSSYMGLPTSQSKGLLKQSMEEMSDVDVSDTDSDSTESYEEQVTKNTVPIETSLK